MLNLPEELLLLALRDKKGTIVTSASTALGYGLAGAVLMELTLEGRLVIEKGKFKLIDTTPIGDDILDDALSKIKSSRKNRKPAYWVSKLSGIKKLKDRLLERLVHKGILRREEHRILRVIPSKRYPTVYAEPEKKLRDRIRAAILNGVEPDEHTTIVISLVSACNLVNEIFEKDERKAARKRMKEIIEGEPIGKAVSDTMAAVQVAVTAAIVAVTISSSVTH